jgi:hypothetical protein
LHQIDQQIEDLRLQCDQLRPAPQLASVDVEKVIAKKKFHIGLQKPGAE